MASQKIEKPSLIHQTEQWLVLSKPAGWLTTAASQPREEDLVLSLWAREQYGSAWPVHRLDLQTSGLVLFARTESAHREANTWFQNHEVKKLYHALASGSLGAPIKKVQLEIQGQPALSQIESKEKFAHAFLAHVVPRSGKRHQIRIHLASLKNPILGDVKYGGLQTLGKLTFDRVALHAASLELPSGERFECPWPEDFQSWVARLRSGVDDV